MAQYDITTMMGIESFDFKDFIINNLTLTHKSLNKWYFEEVFGNKDVLCEFLFFYYQYNFYPKMGGWRRDREGTRCYEFELIKKRLIQGMERRASEMAGK